MKKIELKVRGMVCSGCENRVINSLKMIENIVNVQADYKKEIVIIEGEDNLDLDKIKQRIDDLGFNVIGE